MRRLFLSLIILPLAATLRAQVVERPEPFDDAGRVMTISSSAAARLELRPPAWRVTGDYDEARLYSLDTAYVIVVTRPGGVVERYTITRADREYLRIKANTLPPGLAEEAQVGLRHAARSVQVATRRRFVLNQSVLGLGVYAPSFAAAISNNDAAQGAAYLLVAGGTFFAANELARDYEISTEQTRLSSHAAVSGALAGYGLAYAFDAAHDTRAASIFLGGIGGTAAGLYLGRGLTDGEVAAVSFGSDLAALLAFAAAYAAAPDSTEQISRAGAAAIVVAGLAGYPLGLWYPSSVSYTVTGGDINTLWATGAVGALATSAVLKEHSSNAAVALTLASGLILGTAAGDLLLVRRFDHTRTEATLVTLGAVAGGLIGAGIVVLTNPSRPDKGVVRGIAALGGAGGIALAERYLSPKAESWRGTSSRITIDPAGLALALASRGSRAPDRATFRVVTLRF